MSYLGKSKFLYFSFKYKLASLKKLIIIRIIIKPIGKAAIIETVCKFAIEFLENNKAIGNNISNIAQKSLSFLFGSSSGFNFLHE